MDTLIIKSIEPDAKLTFFKLGPSNTKGVVNGFRAKLESHKTPSSECDVCGADVVYLYDFLCSINKQIHKNHIMTLFGARL